MIYRIIGSLLIVGICVVGYVINNENESSVPVQMNDEDASVKNFKL